jgi:RNA recognition motif-containing protein
LFVKYIPNTVSEADLIDIFKPFGNVISVKSKVGKNDSRFNQAYVLYEDVESC